MKKLLILIGICLIFLCCGPKFDEIQATDIIKQSFELTEEDSLEILGISMESKEVALVKFKLNDVQISSKMRKYDKGWQLDEIQNDFGMWVPAENLTKLFSQSEKIKIAMIDITVISTAIVDYVTDNGIAPKQDDIYDEDSEFYMGLSPFYVKELPVKDPWGNNYRVYCRTAGNGKYGITDCGNDDFVVVSYGRDGEEEIWEFDAMNPEGGIFVVNTADDYDRDLVMWNGSWIRAPRSVVR